MFEKILIANRGEIAVRIIKACKEMGIKSVAIYSEADKDALHTKMADEAICIGPAPSGDSYLNMENIISAAVGTGSQAIHPGFGFLSENSLFAEKCKVCNITFIGPTSEVICKMGNKVEARNMMRNAGVPIISGSWTPVFGVCEAKKVALELGFPIMIKAAAGGGGKGMRISNTEDDFNENFVTAQMEANSSFRDGTMYLERYIEAPNHIEFQILADKYGNVIQLEKMERYVMEKLSGVFHKISFQKKEGQEVFVDMGVAAFMKKGLGVAIQYETDSQQHIFIKKMEMQGQDIKGKFVFQMQQKQR